MASVIDITRRPFRPVFQCQLTRTSATVLTLNRFSGAWVMIAGECYLIPSAGLTVGNGGLSNNTTYYVYANDDGTGNPVLEINTTVPVKNTTFGHLVKTGDASRTYVGRWDTDGSAEFVADAYTTFGQLALSPFVSLSALGLLTLGATLPSHSVTTSITVPLINLTGGQIAFPASQNASADANTLDDYEEGTWTPVFEFTTNGDLARTYTTQSGDYTKNGREVRATGQTLLATFTHTTASGQAIMTGLPFAAAATSHSTVGSTAWGGITKANYTQVGAFILSGASRMAFFAFGSAVAISPVAAADMPTGGAPNLAATCCYHV